MNFLELKLISSFSIFQNEEASSSSSAYIGTGPARDLNTDRLFEADSLSQNHDKNIEGSLQFIRIENSNTTVPETFRVSSSSITSEKQSAEFNDLCDLLNVFAFISTLRRVLLKLFVQQ